MTKTRSITRWGGAVATLALLTACATAPAPAPTPVPPPATPTKPAPPVEPTVKDPPPAPPKNPEADLTAGISAYEDGNYQIARKRLDDALSAGLAPKGEVQAHKYLAFIACASHQRVHCKQSFQRALQIDPQFELSASEAGHPVWGKVFKETKAEMTKKPAKKK